MTPIRVDRRLLFVDYATPARRLLCLQPARETPPREPGALGVGVVIGTLLGVVLTLAVVWA